MFQVGHGIAVDSKGLIWVSDRENQRIQVFDQGGRFVKEMKIGGLPCNVSIGEQYVYLVDGHAGQLLRLDLNGNVLAAVGKEAFAAVARSTTPEALCFGPALCLSPSAADAPVPRLSRGGGTEKGANLIPCCRRFFSCRFRVGQPGSI